MRRLDWSATSVGDPQTWSPALRTMVGLLLRNRFPLLLCWGQDHVQFYNDAYRPIPGDKHPRCLGQRAEHCWPEIWDVIGPMIRAPLTGEPATWSDDLPLMVRRSGYLEETHFKVAYSPVPDESVPGTGIGGVLATVSEITAQVYSERQSHTLRELGARVADARSAREALASAAAVLAENRADVPFATLYALDGGVLRKVAGDDVVPASELCRTAQILRLPPGPRSPWGAPVERALVLPLATEQGECFLVAGISPHRALDDGYRTFFELAAAQVVTAIRNARALEAAAEASQELEAALEEARAANRTKDDFFALLGHELRNPLAPIVTALELMELRGHTDVANECSVIERQTDHLIRLVDDLMDVERIARGKVELHVEALDLGEVIAKAVELASPLFERKRHRLELDIEGGFVVSGDRQRLAQVFANLLVNAAKYTDAEGTISVDGRAIGDRVRVTVRDNGVGISPDILPHVFDMFVQERQSVDRARGGLGLGLTLVKSLVARHGGTVAAESAGVGQGSTFEVELPIVVGAVASRRTRLASRLPTMVARSRRILIVEDNEDAARTLATAISALGHQIRIANDGPEALDIARGFVPELALLDIGLPVMDGYQVGSRLRELDRMSDVRLVAVTGYGQPADRSRSEELGFDAHLVKPVDLRHLSTLIEELLS